MSNSNMASSPIVAQPKIIGIYGLPGSGKTTLKNTLQSGDQRLNEERFTFFEGSEIVCQIAGGDIEAFKKLPQSKQRDIREKAITRIREVCASKDTVGIVTGHFMFWNEGSECPASVLTPIDWEVYTHILYLDKLPAKVAYQIREDTTRTRKQYSNGHLAKWQGEEKRLLRSACLERGILFAAVPADDRSLTVRYVKRLVQDFSDQDEVVNTAQALRLLDEQLISLNGSVRNMMIIDGDKTLTSQDTGKTFWDLVKQDYSDAWRQMCNTDTDTDPSTAIFTKMQYSYTAFRQVMLAYQELDMQDPIFDKVCLRTAQDTILDEHFKTFLKRVGNKQGASAVIVTCGLARVWRLILEKENIQNVSVIGGGLLENKFVVTPEIKAEVISHLQKVHNMEVLAFGDSQVDLKMLRQANRAFVVVGPLESRSRSMDRLLADELAKGLKAEQILLPENVPHRLTLDQLPTTSLEVLPLEVTHATGEAVAKILMSSTRDNRVQGPALRNAHHLIGHYLALQFVAAKVGLETYRIPLVTGKEDDGHCLFNEDRTLIVPLMRGGEPMAFGVSEAFPRAAFYHTKDGCDLKAKHLDDISTVILVDSVINTGVSIVKAVSHIRSIKSTIRIVVVAGVVQAAAVGPNGIAKDLETFDKLTIVALRLSENKFKGKGGTDTGHRLFNTTNWD